jgi:hypothetical protein
MRGTGAARADSPSNARDRGGRCVRSSPHANRHRHFFSWICRLNFSWICRLNEPCAASWLVLAPFEAPIAAWNGDHRVSAPRRPPNLERLAKLVPLRIAAMPSSCLYKIAHLATKRLPYKATVFRLEHDPKSVLGAAFGPGSYQLMRHSSSACSPVAVCPTGKNVPDGSASYHRDWA